MILCIRRLGRYACAMSIYLRFSLYYIRLSHCRYTYTNTTTAQGMAEQHSANAIILLCVRYHNIGTQQQQLQQQQQ